MKQLCFFSKVCDGEFNKSTKRSIHFHCNFVYMNIVENFVKKTQKYFKMLGVTSSRIQGDSEKIWQVTKTHDFLTKS